jgi:adenylosuccinate lyase
MGREVAHQLIKKHSTSTTAGNFFEALAKEKDFPLSLDQLNKLILSPVEFTGLALIQINSVKEMITGRIKDKISKVELTDLR